MSYFKRRGIKFALGFDVLFSNHRLDINMVVARSINASTPQTLIYVESDRGLDK